MALRKLRIDQLLIERGLASDLRTARGWIIDRQVVSEGRVIDKAGERLPDNAALCLRVKALRYASKGGYKLEHAISTFAVDVSGHCVLDAGASTGGFTDCLLQHGAAQIYAVDVGYGQLRGRLAADGRVRVMERTNISDLKAASFERPIDLATVDLSYLSLRQAFPILAGCFAGQPRIIALIKPLYEGLPQENPTDPDLIRSVLQALFSDLAMGPVPVLDTCVSPILGGRGAVEFLVYAEQGGMPALSPAALAEKAMSSWARKPPMLIDEVA
jgi:23S rRNA (cytidine1920-2'-O)/16S rRNA (cytidine1409-2'-O)-methyltransferase